MSPPFGGHSVKGGAHRLYTGLASMKLDTFKGGET